MPVDAWAVFAEGRGGKDVKHGDVLPDLALYQSGGPRRRVVHRLRVPDAPGCGWYVGFDPAVIAELERLGVARIEVVIHDAKEVDLYATDVETAARLGLRHNFGQGYADRWLVPVECFDVRNHHGTLTHGRSLWWDRQGYRGRGGSW